MLARLEDEARPTVTVKAAAAYGTPPPDFREKLAEDEGDAMLANAFGAALEKNAGWAPAEVEPTEGEVTRDWQMKLGGLEHVTAEASGVEVMYDQAVSRFDSAIKQAAMNGADLAHIGAVLHDMCGEKTASMRPHLTRCLTTLATEGVVLEMPSEEKVVEAQARVVDPASELAQSANYLLSVQDHRLMMKHAVASLTEKEAEARRRVKAL